MSRVAKVPVKIPAGVQVTQTGREITVKGAKTSLSFNLPQSVDLAIAESEIRVSPESMKADKMQSGTVRALLQNMVTGVTTGYQRKLQLVGVGYRAAVQGKVLNLSVGLSHPVNYPIPEGISVECPTQTEILVKGASKHMVGQVSADIRSYRPPEPYKGKGVRYSDEKVELKEAKKK
jgi:large subunit ribosomal protein L6